MYEMYCWVVAEDDGTEGVICGLIPAMAQLGMGPMPLQHHKREVAEQLRPLAESHGRLDNKPVRLVHLVEAETG
jgi:hypothetical protein